MLNGVDLFTGIGGMSIALREWVRPIAYCEIDTYCQGVLLSNICNRSLFQAPIWDDIRSLRSTDFDGLDIDIIYGGFPCQDISIAGNGKGLEGQRSGLFFEIVRLANEIRPKFIFLENVPAITTRGGLEVVKEITKMGYDCRWITIAASSMGTLHKRERWFLLAHSTSTRSLRLQGREKTTHSKSKQPIEYKSIDYGVENEPSLLGVNDVVPFRMDRARTIGNAVVPAQAKKAFEILMGLDK